jgi:hypothetical protein
MMNFLRKVRSSIDSARREPGRLMLRPAPDVKASLHQDGMVLIHHRSGTVFSSNRVGAMIWKGTTEGRSLDEVAASISGEFDIPQQTVQQDAARFLAQLEAEGLLVAVAT